MNSIVVPHPQLKSMKGKASTDRGVLNILHSVLLSGFAFPFEILHALPSLVFSFLFFLSNYLFLTLPFP